MSKLINNSIPYFVIFLFFISFLNCKNFEENENIVQKNNTKIYLKKIPKDTISIIETRKKISDFIPIGYKIFEEIQADFNNDGIKDCIVIIKGTNKENIIVDENRGKLDRNRRGIIALLKVKDNYELVVKNYDCFSSENEDGGTYFAPELIVELEKSNLYIHYAHGRYGYWKYTFRLKNTDFELIGYDSSDNFGPRVNSETSINFLTKKKITLTNTNENAEGGDEVFEEKIERIKQQTTIKLSEILNFDELEID